MHRMPGEGEKTENKVGEKLWIDEGKRDEILKNKPFYLSKSAFWAYLVNAGCDYMTRNKFAEALQYKRDKELEWMKELDELKDKHEFEIAICLDSQDGYDMLKINKMLTRHHNEIEEFIVSVLDKMIEN